MRIDNVAVAEGHPSESYTKAQQALLGGCEKEWCVPAILSHLCQLPNVQFLHMQNW
jgi:hypothetical protein